MRDYRGSSKKLPSDWRTKSSCQKNRQAYNCGANTGTLFTLSVFFPYVKLRTTNPFSRGFLLCQTEDQHSHSYFVLTESFKHCQGFQWDCFCLIYIIGEKLHLPFGMLYSWYYCIAGIYRSFPESVSTAYCSFTN